MRTLIRCLPAAVVVLTAVTTAVARDDAEPAVHDEIRELRDGLLAAIEQKDADTLLTFVHEDVVLTVQDGKELKAIRKKDGVRDYIERLLTGDSAGVSELKLNVEVDELTILHGDDSGVAFGHSADSYVLRDGSAFKLPTRWTATLVRAHDGWKLASLQVSSNLFQNPLLDALKNAAWIGGTALGLAVVVAFILGRRMGGSDASDSDSKAASSSDDG